MLETLAFHAHLCLHVTVLAGRDPHHIVEAQFKAVARALRDAIALDPRVDGRTEHQGEPGGWEVGEIVVLDYGSGNIRSAERAVARTGARGGLSRRTGVAIVADGLVVPGGGCVRRLHGGSGWPSTGRR